MPSRPSWAGFLRFNLISVPVKGYNAIAASGDKVRFHMLCKKCHSRIRYKKVCPVHGEITNDQIISGYEYAKKKYVTVEADEKGELKSEDDKIIGIDSFIPADLIDPIYFSGRSFYLVPDGHVAQKPYRVLLEAMQDQGCYAVAQVVFAGRSRVAVVRPSAGVLTMSLLNFESEVKKPTEFAGEIDASDITVKERELGDSLVETATAKHFDLGSYKDEYSGKLKALVQGKTKHKRTSKDMEEGPPAVINLMDALRRSLSDARKKSSGKSRKTTRARTHKAPRAASKRKTG